MFNSFQANVLFLYPLKTSQSFWFSDVLMDVEIENSGLKWVKMFL